MKRNLGLTSKQKLFGQILIAVVFYITLLMNTFPSYISVPGTSLQWGLGWLYTVVLVFMLVGSTIAINLPVGLDELLAVTASVDFGAFALLASYFYPEFEFVTMFALTVVGALLGFLVFNAHPAKVFMGDTGSLSLGATIAAIAILTKMEIILVIIGGVFVIETLSVI